jgi:hypothetical protein
MYPRGDSNLYSPECVEKEFSEVPELRPRGVFARMLGREAGPRLRRG